MSQENVDLPEGIAKFNQKYRVSYVYGDKKYQIYFRSLERAIAFRQRMQALRLKDSLPGVTRPRVRSIKRDKTLPVGVYEVFPNSKKEKYPYIATLVLYTTPDGVRRRKQYRCGYDSPRVKRTRADAIHQVIEWRKRFVSDLRQQGIKI